MNYPNPDEYQLLLGVARKARKAIETLALDSPNLFKFDELNELSAAVDKWDKWCEEEK